MLVNCIRSYSDNKGKCNGGLITTDQQHRLKNKISGRNLKSNYIYFSINTLENEEKGQVNPKHKLD